MRREARARRRLFCSHAAMGLRGAVRVFSISRVEVMVEVFLARLPFMCACWMLRSMCVVLAAEVLPVACNMGGEHRPCAAVAGATTVVLVVVYSTQSHLPSPRASTPEQGFQ